MTGPLAISGVILAMALLIMQASAASTMTAAALVGSWVQDDTGPVLTHRKRYQFHANGSYDFSFTSRNTGTTDQKMLAHETGTFRVDGQRLVMSPTSGSPKVVPWRVEKDQYTGSPQLVMGLPDGKPDIYYRE